MKRKKSSTDKEYQLLRKKTHRNCLQKYKMHFADMYLRLMEPTSITI